MRHGALVLVLPCVRQQSMIQTMPTITFTAADFRDPEESSVIHLDAEGPVEPNDDGSCYCRPARKNPWDHAGGIEEYKEAIETIARLENLALAEAAEVVRRAYLDVPAELASRHWHLKISGKEPDASPRYYELPMDEVPED